MAEKLVSLLNFLAFNKSQIYDKVHRINKDRLKHTWEKRTEKVAFDMTKDAK